MSDPVSTDNPEEQEEVEKPDPRIKRPDLYNAVKENDTEAAISLLTEEVPPNYIDRSNGWTALHWAAMHGNARLAKKLIECGASEPYHRLIRIAKAAKAKKQQSSITSGSASIDGGSGSDSTTTAEEGAPEEGDEDESEDRALERKFNLNRSTPLMWATMMGHLNVVWLLIADGYSPNDVDDLNNNILHIAAASGHHRILSVLIQDGGNIYAQNIYKNWPMHLANTTETHELLSKALEEQPVPLTELDIADRHNGNVQKYTRMLNSLSAAVQEANKMDSPRGVAMLMSSSTAVEEEGAPGSAGDKQRGSVGNMAGGGTNESIIRQLGSAIDDAKEWCVGEELVVQAEKLLTRMELMLDLRNEVVKLQQNMPIETQNLYIQYVQPVEKILENVDQLVSNSGGASTAEKPLLQFARDMIASCQIEYWICVLRERLINVECARDCHEHDMKKLKAAIQKGQAFRATESVLEDAEILLRRLEGELGLTRSIAIVPTDKDVQATATYSTAGEIVLPTVNPDGTIVPTADDIALQGAESLFTALTACIDALKSGLHSSEGTGANAQVISDATAKLTRAQKDFKLVEAKVTDLKARCAEAQAKLAKKKKKGGGKKK